MDDLPCSQKFIRGIADAIVHCRACENSVHKSMLWTWMMGMISSLSSFRQRSQRCCFLSYTLHIILCDYGIGVFTERDWQVNVNLVVPVCDNEATRVRLICEVLHTLEVRYPDSCIRFESELMPSNTGLSKRRRFIQDPKSDLSLVDKKWISCGAYKQLLERYDMSPQDIVEFRPLGSLKCHDPDDAVYWYRFSCGTLAAFKNPWMPDIPSLPLPPPVHDLNLVRGSLNDESIFQFLQTLSPPLRCQNFEQLAIVSIPFVIRQMSVQAAKAKFGIDDDMIIKVGLFAKEAPVKERSPFVCDLLRMHEIMMNAFRKQDDTLAESLCDLLHGCDDQKTWSMWLYRSPFIYACMDRFSTSVVDTICRTFPPFRTVLSYFLKECIPNWTTSQRQKACTVLNDDTPPTSENDPVISVRAEVERLNEACHSTDSDASRAKHKVKRLKKKLKKQAAKAACRSEAATAPLLEEFISSVDKTSASVTHEDVVARMRTTFDFDMTLIGSGCFHNQSDIDVVIRVNDPSLTLSEVYDAVEKKTGWHRVGVVDGERVCIMSGTFEGKDVDAQCWRGDGSSSCAEAYTLKALELTERFRNGMTTAMCESICKLHTFLHDADLKGHLYGRLPGIGVTCLGVMLSRRCRDDETPSLKTLIAGTRELLMRDQPVFDLDDLVPDATLAPCNGPLHCNVEGTNVTHRMTAATTRHMLDVISAAPNESASSWRWHHMHLVAKMIPRSSSTIARCLHTALAQLDGHPLIHSLYVKDEDGILCIYCTCKSDSRYTFRDTDIVERDEKSGHFFLRRGARTYPLLVEAKPATALWCHRKNLSTERLPCLGEERELSVLNAPFLFSDVRAAFDSEYWL